MIPTDDTRSDVIDRWVRAARLDQLPEAEQKAAVDLVIEFCEAQGKSPADVVNGCFRLDKDGDRAISVKGRRAIQEAIDEYVRGIGLVGHPATVTGNRIRGFLIHNGVFLQGRVSSA